jgi:hypothetical protein
MGKYIRKIVKLLLLENPKKDKNKLSAPVRNVSCHIRSVKYFVNMRKIFILLHCMFPDF